MLCPSRDRPKQFLELAKSICNTTNHADLVGYVDEDQADMYKTICESARPETRARMSVHVGPRMGPVAACNYLVEAFPGYDIYGMVPDDARMNANSWSEWCLSISKHLPNRIGVISPHHNQGVHIDMPFVTKEWIKVTGWFALPSVYHFVWPIVTGLIGEMTASIVHAPEHSFSVEHDFTMPQNQVHRTADAENFFNFVANELLPIVYRMREAMRPD